MSSMESSRVLMTSIDVTLIDSYESPPPFSDHINRTNPNLCKFFSPTKEREIWCKKERGFKNFCARFLFLILFVVKRNDDDESQRG